MARLSYVLAFGPTLTSISLVRSASHALAFFGAAVSLLTASALSALSALRAGLLRTALLGLIALVAAAFLSRPVALIALVTTLAGVGV